MPFARLCRRLSRSPLRLVALALAGALLAPPSTSAQILEAPQAHDFGVVKVGRRVTGHLALRNQDDDDATVRVVVSGPPFEAAADTVRLPGRGGADLEVSCRALAPGPYRGNLELHVDRLFGSRVVAVALQAVAERPRLELSPEPGSGLALGSAAVGQTVRRTLAVTNRGRVDLLIDSLSLDGGDLAFTLERPGALRLEPGARQDLPVAFTPRRDGPVAARLLIHSSDLAPPVVALPVSGA
ncbi:MAG: choice-of-anchor D domain-containing protein, partial [Gemmatimonadota bacterium]